MMYAALIELAKLGILKSLALVDLARRVVRPIHGGVIRTVVGGQVSGSRGTLCVFAHFDRDGVIDDYVVDYLQALDRLQCETVVVSTAENLDDGNIRKALPFCSRFIIKRNIGYDFASWRTALAAVGDLARYDRLVVANDSVYGPLQDLAAVFEEMEARDVDFWGITDSLKYGRHVQSYFVVYGKSVLQSPEFRDFWLNLPDYRHKYVVIIEGEVGLSRRLAEAGFAFAAYCPVEGLEEGQEIGRGKRGRKFRDPRISPTHRAWRALMRARCPFLKVQLLRDNPMDVPDLEEWETVLGEISDYELDLIRNHLARMRGNGDLACNAGFNMRAGELAD